jgi:4-amino-4-deoxy-L-arabinose transferase-like glycosyltransferase
VSAQPQSPREPQDQQNLPGQGDTQAPEDTLAPEDTRETAQQEPWAQAEAGPAQPSGLQRPWPRRAALALIAALAAVLYGWAVSQDTLEFYYAAAVRSMSLNWHNFIFGALDPAGTISLDKLPGAFWIQALAVHAFGFHTWVIILPQTVEGVLTVLVLYRAVSRLAGPAAGLIAALAIAVSPATVALNRGNISDSLMILLLVLAADSVSAAIAPKRRGARSAWGTQGRLILAAFWVGLAFQAKMIEAWLVLPAFGLAYLLDGPGPLARRVRHLVVAGIVAGIVSLAWMTAVALVPAANRPYADGSSNDSVYAQVFVYNGFGRFGDQTPIQLLASEVSPDLAIPVQPASADRLFTGNLGRDSGWLLPAALLAAVWGIASRVRRPRGDALRACFVLWGAWLLILAVTFSAATYVQTYYTAALTPAIAALLAAAAVTVLAPGARRAGRAGAGGAAADGVSARGAAVARRAGLVVVSAGTTAYAVWLVPSQGAHIPGWLIPAIIALGAAAVTVAIASAFTRRTAAATAAVAAVLVAALAAPTVASAGLAANHESAFDTPFEPTRLAGLIASVPARLAVIQRAIPRLQFLQVGAPDLLAAQSSYIASLFIYTSGLEALPIGGFTGTTPSPTLGQIQADIRSGQFHLVLGLSTADPRMRWIATHCRDVGGKHTYYCVRADA